jgi:hypothetical protein
MSSSLVETSNRCRDDSDDELRGGMESEARLDEHARARDDQYVWSSAPVLGVVMLFSCCNVPYL